LKIGLIGASVRAAAQALRDSGQLSLAIDRFADSETVDVMSSRCLVARDWNHAKSLVIQFSKTPRLRRRGKSNSQGIHWLLAGGLELEPKLLAALSWGGGSILGCSVEAIEFAKDPGKWCNELSKVHPFVPDFSQQARTTSGEWFLKQAWPNRNSEPAVFWQRKIHGRLGSAVFLASVDGVELIGTSLLRVTSDSALGNHHYLGNLVFTRRSTPNRPTVFEGQPLIDSANADPTHCAALMDDHHCNQLHAMGSWFAQTTGSRGLFGIDFIANEQIWPIEINPRATASVEIFSQMLGRNLYLEHVQACTPVDPAKPKLLGVDLENPDQVIAIETDRVEIGEKPLGNSALCGIANHEDRRGSDPLVLTGRSNMGANRNELTAGFKGLIAIEPDREEVLPNQAMAKLVVYQTLAKSIKIDQHKHAWLMSLDDQWVRQLVEFKEGNFGIQRLTIRDTPKIDTEIPAGEPICSLLLWFEITSTSIRNSIIQNPVDPHAGQVVDDAIACQCWQIAERIGDCIQRELASLAG